MKRGGATRKAPWKDVRIGTPRGVAIRVRVPGRARRPRLIFHRDGVQNRDVLPQARGRDVPPVRLPTECNNG